MFFVLNLLFFPSLRTASHRIVSHCLLSAFVPYEIFAPLRERNKTFKNETDGVYLYFGEK
jgi:hypothetical protein